MRWLGRRGRLPASARLLNTKNGSRFTAAGDLKYLGVKILGRLNSALATGVWCGVSLLALKRRLRLRERLEFKVDSGRGKSRVAGIEPTHTVLKTVVLPLNYTPLFTNRV